MTSTQTAASPDVDRDGPASSAPARDEAGVTRPVDGPTESPRQTSLAFRVFSGVVSALVPIALLGGAGAVAWWLLSTSPEQETTPGEAIVPTVEIVAIEPGVASAVVRGFGTVMPAREVRVAPEIAGRVIEVGPTVEPGGLVEAGALLFRIDPADYDIAVAGAEADLAQARADLELERGRGLVARQEWERFRETLDGVDESTRSAALANREPQLRQVEARVQQAEAALALARLRLERTAVLAPFDATVLDESVEVGLRVDPGQGVVRLAGVEVFWVTVSVPSAQAGRLPRPTGGGAVDATVTTSNGLAESTSRQGRFVRVLPEADPAGRMTRVLIAIEDPLALESTDAPIRLGDYAEVALEVEPLEGVVQLPREALRENGQVWLLTPDGTLRIAPVEVRWRGDATIAVSLDFEPGERVITSFLNDPLPGQTLRVREAS